MIATLPYGASEVAATLPDRTVELSNVEVTTLPPVNDLETTVRAALAAPMGLPPVRELVRPGARVTIAFDDATVASYGPIRGVAIKSVLNELAAAGVARADVTLLCANALHRKLRPSELGRLIGHDLVTEFGERLLCHDAEDRANLVDLGTTAPHGYPVEVHRLAVESDLTVYVNARHNRGFNGGWKSVCVGLSTYRSIAVHHTPDGMSMSVRENRMHAVLDEMGTHFERATGRRIFKIDTILTDHLRVARVFAGSVAVTRQRVLETMSALFPPRRGLARGSFDVFVYGVPDWSPYAVWSHMNPILTLISSGLGYLGGMIEALGRPGCTVIMATPVPDRWDEVHHPSYREVWQRVLPDTRDPYRIMDLHAGRFAGRADYIEKYRHAYGFHPVHAIMAIYPLKRLAHVGRVIVAGPDDPAVPRHLGFETAPRVEDAVARAETFHGRDCAIACIKQPAAPAVGDAWAAAEGETAH
jgi:lactate racemase